MSHGGTWQEHFQWNEKIYISVKRERTKDWKTVMPLQWLPAAVSRAVSTHNWCEGTVKTGEKSRKPIVTPRKSPLMEKSWNEWKQKESTNLSLHEHHTYNEEPASIKDKDKQFEPTFKAMSTTYLKSDWEFLLWLRGLSLPSPNFPHRLIPA